MVVVLPLVDIVSVPIWAGQVLVSAMRFGSLGLIIIGTQLDGSASYLGPALVFTLLDFRRRRRNQ